MQDFITDFTLISSIRRIVHDTYSRHMMEPASVYHDFVISQVWNWIYTPEVLNQRAETKELVELLRKEYGLDAVDDKGIIDGYQRYEIKFSNVKFYIVQLPMSYRINAARPVTNVAYVSCCNPEETLAYMRSFNDAIPAVHDYVEQNISLANKEHLISEVTAASGKVYFADSPEKIN